MISVRSGVALAVFLCSLVSANVTLRVIQPSTLREKFISGNVPTVASLFGQPVDVTGKLITLPEELRNGCQSFAIPDEMRSQSVVLLKRGTCTFVTKVRYAQEAGASAVVVINDKDDLSSHMGAERPDMSVIIPSALVGKSDGQLLLDWIENNKDQSIQLNLSYNYKKGNKVQLTVYDNPANTQLESISEFKEVVNKLVKSEQMTIDFHEALINGEVYQCNAPQQPCASQCTNMGRYCAVDPNHDLNSDPTGASVVQEALRRICIRETTTANDPIFLWTYKNQFIEQCVKTNRFNENCSREVCNSIDSSVFDKVKECVEKSGGAAVDTDAKNELLEKEIKLKEDNGVYLVPSVYINGDPYYGTLSCDLSSGMETCPMLKIVCNAYEESSRPDLCRVSGGCGFEQERDVCGQCHNLASPRFIKNKDECYREIGGVSVGTIIGLIVICIAILVGAAFVYHQRSAVKMRDELRSIMSQYVPLEGDSSGGTERTQLV